MVGSNFSPKEISLYIHIPFCRHKCHYCHFYVIPDNREHKELLLSSLKKEWSQARAKIPKDYKLVSLYFGGGTPALFEPKRIGQIIEWIRDQFPEDLANTEVTLEANPEDVTKSLIQDYSKVGINRISMGVQSLNDRELTTLTRRHDAQKAINAIHTIREAGIDNLSIDLMYDLPHQENTDWIKSCHQTAKLPITHLSLYNLTIEPHTVFYKYRDKLLPQIPSEQTSQQMYQEAQKIFDHSGLKQYEISAFAKKNYHSIHNSGYWLGRPFLGLGPSAYSFFEGKRFRNIPNLHRYARDLESGKSAVKEIDTLSEECRLKELLVIRLRLLQGFDLNTFQTHFGTLEKESLCKLEELKALHLLTEDEGRLKLTQKGILLYDSIASELI